MWKLKLELKLLGAFRKLKGAGSLRFNTKIHLINFFMEYFLVKEPQKSYTDILRFCGKLPGFQLLASLTPISNGDSLSY